MHGASAKPISRCTGVCYLHRFLRASGGGLPDRSHHKLQGLKASELSALKSHESMGICDAAFLLQIVSVLSQVQPELSPSPAIQKVMTYFCKVFQEPSGLPPLRFHDHSIPLLPGSKPMSSRPYRQPYFQKNEIKKQVRELLMGDRRSKEDYVHQILTSIYVTNFPEQFSFRDLWKKCQEYGRVIDVYIPNRRTKSEGEIQSEDPFHIYDLLVKKPKNDNKEEESSKATLKYPFGFTSDDVLRTKDVQDVDDVVEVQENTQKSGILSAWDPRMFHKHNTTISDYFIAIQGEWIANAKKYLVISFYAPQEASEKRMLWSYLNHMIDRFIVDTWSNMSISDTNAISKFMKKLRHLKLQTRLWEHLNKRMNVINSIHDLEKLEATEVTQKAKIKWSIEGDENSKFFHGILNKKRNQHAIRGILSEESNVTIEEIKRAVWDCGIDKSSGPDGLTFGFYRRYWDIIKKDVVDAVSFFFISILIGSLYKIIAKILANRLVGVLGELVNEVKSAFIVNRQILDGPFMLDELIHWCHAKKKETMIFKVDFGKAYDSVRWDYLDDVLNKFGFVLNWRNWIHNCLNSSKGSILVNGSPTGEFQFRKGLKQGEKDVVIQVVQSVGVKRQRRVGGFKFFALNRALLFKWMWRFFNDKDALWSRFIRAVHGNRGGIETHSRVSYSSTWLFIVNEVNKMRNKDPSFKKMSIKARLSYGMSLYFSYAF
nr:RNA-directed DNA polymerase, eukaryota, reverse transcriptase zinc-binding domain protein [Tanacetum cinerariifolium]